MDQPTDLTPVEDPVFLSFLLSCLEEAGIETVVLDQHTSAALGGAVGAIRARVCVPAAQLARARQVLARAEAGERP
jgi:hypothetical protein